MREAIVFINFFNLLLLYQNIYIHWCAGLLIVKTCVFLTDISISVQVKKVGIYYMK